jgi:opacity protein-like surface antigen
MKLKSSIIALVALSSMSFAGGTIGEVTTFENTDYVEAEVNAVEVTPVYEEVVAPTPAPVVTPTPAKVVPKEVTQKASTGPLGIYLGGAIAAMASRSDCEGNRANVFADEKGQDRQLGITGVLGYDFMDYLGAELRASMAVDGDDDGSEAMTQYGLYLKPNYDVTDALNLYALLGYSAVNMSDCGTSADLDEMNSGFSYGAGLDYGVTENISVFTDIVNYLMDDDTRSTWGTNLGLKYNF